MGEKNFRQPTPLVGKVGENTRNIGVSQSDNNCARLSGRRNTRWWPFCCCHAVLNEGRRRMREHYYMEMNVELYAPADSPPGRKPPEPMRQEIGWSSKTICALFKIKQLSVPVEDRNLDSQNVHPIIQSLQSAITCSVTTSSLLNLRPTYLTTLNATHT